MKVVQSILVVSVTLMTISSANAQYGNNGYYGNGIGNGNGAGGPIGATAGNQYKYEKSKETLDKERAENTNKSVETLKNELNLDELQLVIVRKEVEESNKKIYALAKEKDKSQDELAAEINAITEKMDTTINTFLNNEQKVKYKVIIESRKERINKIKNKK